MKAFFLICLLAPCLWGQGIATLGEGRTPVGDIALGDYSHLGGTELGPGLEPAWYGNLTTPYSSSSEFLTTSYPQDSGVFCQIDLGAELSGTVSTLEARVQGMDTTAREACFTIWSHSAGTGLPDVPLWTTGRTTDGSTASAATVSLSPALAISSTRYLWVSFSSEVRSDVAKLYNDADGAGNAFTLPVSQYTEFFDGFEVGEGDTFSGLSGSSSLSPSTASAEIRLYVE